MSSTSESMLGPSSSNYESRDGAVFGDTVDIAYQNRPSEIEEIGEFEEVKDV